MMMLQQESRESIDCDYFIDAMDNADFALKIPERTPTTLAIKANRNAA